MGKYKIGDRFEREHDGYKVGLLIINQDSSRVASKEYSVIMNGDIFYCPESTIDEWAKINEGEEDINNE